MIVAEDCAAMMAILLRHVSKSFVRKPVVGASMAKKERRHVLKDVSIEVEEGEIVCILGKNGSGKTTLVRILSTLVEPDTGFARICGFDTITDGQNVRKCLGVMLNAGEGGFHARLSALANLEYYAALYKIPPGEGRKRALGLLRDLELDDRGADQYQSYSTGMRRRLALVRTLLSNAPVLILDEPTLGVDQWSTKRIHNYLIEVSKRGTTILCATNNPSEAQALGNRCRLLEDGILHGFNPKEVLVA